MAIIKEEYECKNGTILIHTYSNENMKIEQIETGILYAEAYDIPNRYTYKETSEPIESIETNEI